MLTICKLGLPVNTANCVQMVICYFNNFSIIFYVRFVKEHFYMISSVRLLGWKKDD